MNLVLASEDEGTSNAHTRVKKKKYISKTEVLNLYETAAQ
jgi:hypothetical protein